MEPSTSFLYQDTIKLKSKSTGKKVLVRNIIKTLTELKNDFLEFKNLHR